METPQQKKGTSKGKEVYLDTTGACFLCLREPSADSVLAGNTNVGGGVRVSMRDICRFLEINELEGFLSNDGSDLSTQGEQLGFSVTLCDNCATPVNQLAVLIHEMEEIQKRLARQLGILEESLSKSQSQQLWERILKKMKNPLTASIVGFLRKEAAQKCRDKLKSLTTQTDADVPVVIEGIPTTTTHQTQNEASINPVESEDLTSSNDLTVEPVTSPVSKSSANRGMKRKRSNRHGDNDEVGTDHPRGTLESSKDTAMEVFNRNYRTSGRGKGGPSFDCLHCELAFTGSSSRIRKHLLTDHPETLFPETKTPHLSGKKLMDCINELFKNEVAFGRIEAKKRNKLAINSSKSNGPPMYCIPCDLTYARGLNYKYHLILEHYDGLKKKLASLQLDVLKGKDPIERKGPMDKKKGAAGVRKKFKCSLEGGGCGATFFTPRNLQQHKLRRCPKRQGQVTWACKLEDGGCGKLFLSRRMLTVHQLNSCSNRKSKEDTSEGGVDDGPRILRVTGSALKSSSSLRRTQQKSGGSSVNEEMDVMEEDPEGLEGKGGEASGTGGTNVSVGSDVKVKTEEKSSNVEYNRTADSTTQDDSLFECDVFMVKSE